MHCILPRERPGCLNGTGMGQYVAPERVGKQPTKRQVARRVSSCLPVDKKEKKTDQSRTRQVNHSATEANNRIYAHRNRILLEQKVLSDQLPC